MSEWMMAAILVFAALAAVFAGLSWWAQKRREHDGVELENRLQERIGELGAEIKSSRDQVTELKGALQQMNAQMERLSNESKNSAESVRTATEGALNQFRESMERRLDNMRQDINQSLRDSRESGESNMNSLRDSVNEKLADTVKEVGEIREKTLESLNSVRKDTEGNLGKLRESVDNRLDEMGQRIDSGLRESRESSERKLDQIRHTVDEKLQTTLEKRLGEQFRAVSAQLENVHKGLGEMQALSSQVGNLQRVLTSARDRGQWGEVVLKDIIRQILTPDQYEENVGFDGGERVEFAIRVPVESGLALLPVDSKFPMESYERLVDAEKNGEDPSAHRKALLNSIRNSAKSIRDKYIRPPSSTDFAFLFLPTEGLYAIAASEPGFLDGIQREQKVRVAGPDNFALFLSAVRMGFQLFAAGQRADEIREVLGAVKTEFGEFGKVLSKVRSNLQAATNNIDLTERRVRAMRRKIGEVEELPGQESSRILGLAPVEEEENRGE